MQEHLTVGDSAAQRKLGDVSLLMEANNWCRAEVLRFVTGRDAGGVWRLPKSRHYSRNQAWREQEILRSAPQEVCERWRS